MEYTKFIHQEHTEWPLEGPNTWLRKWEELIAWAEGFKMTIPFWLIDVSAVWTKVPGLTVYFETVERHVLQKKQHKYSVKAISSAIQYNWERRKEGSIMRYQRPRNTCSAFATDATFNGKKAPEAEDTTATKKKSNKRPRSHNKADISADQSERQDHSKRQDNKDDSFPCSACRGSKHYFKKCYLVWGKERD